MLIFHCAFGFDISSQILIARRNGEGRYKDVGPVMREDVLGLAVLMFGLTHLLCCHPLSTCSFHLIRHFDATMEISPTVAYLGLFLRLCQRCCAVCVLLHVLGADNECSGVALVNVLLDYIFDFIKFGMPEMGIKGAAVASVMAEAASLAFS